MTPTRISSIGRQLLLNSLEKYASADAAALEASKPPVRVAGRIVALRLHGKAGFAHISGSGQRLQIYVKLDIVGPRASNCSRCWIWVTSSA